MTAEKNKPTVFASEQDTIAKAEKIINDESNTDNPLLNDYKELNTQYKKLFRQFVRMMKISDRQQQQLISAREEVVKFNDELKQLNATKDKFFSIVAHDLKSPINSFLAISNLLVEHIDQFSIEEIQEMAKDVRNSGDNLIKLLENLLYWARIQMNRYEFQPEKVSLNTIVENNVNLLSLSASQKGVLIKDQVPENTSVVADQNMVNTIIRNLVSNAIKFTKNGDTITVGYKKENNFSCISIQDTGVGIKPEDLENLFKIDVTTTSRGTHNEKGTGLGLILCKEMVEKHNGTIRVESELNKGTTFTFSLDHTIEVLNILQKR